MEDPPQPQDTLARRAVNRDFRKLFCKRGAGRVQLTVSPPPFRDLKKNEKNSAAKTDCPWHAGSGIADPVESPEVIYGEFLPGIYFPAEDGRHGRVSFQGLDALRVCRGEYCPFDNDSDEGKPSSWVFAVENSAWLVERHAYESEHYRDAYEFCGDVDEMLTDYSHYLFRFHDQFVEAIAAGIWFEVADSSLKGKPLPAEHPFLTLPVSTLTGFIDAHGMRCKVRTNPVSGDELIENARYCDYPVMDFILELPDDFAGETLTGFRLSARTRNRTVSSSLRGPLEGGVASFTGVAGLDRIRPYIERWMGEISERRRESGS